MTIGVLLKIKNYKDIMIENEAVFDTVNFFKATFAEYGKVGYVDLDDKVDKLVVRFNEAQSAQNAKKALVEEKKKIRDKELIVEILEGEEEKKYWDENILNKPVQDRKNFTKKRKRFN